MNALNLRLNKPLRKDSVFPDIGVQLIKPLPSPGKCSHRRHGSKNIRLRHLIRIQPPVHPVPQHRVRRKDSGSLDARNIKGLCRRYAGNTIIPARFRYGSKRNVTAARLCQVTMNLIGQNQHMMPDTKLANALQRLSVPYFSNRIMRIAQKQHRSLRIGQLFLQIVKIYGINAVLIPQPAFQNISSVIQDRIEEIVVNGSHHRDILPYGCHLADNTGNSRNNTGTEQQPLLFNGKIMAFLPPALISLVPFLPKHRVAVYAMLRSLSDCLRNLRRRLKIHISHPHGKLMLRHIPFCAAGISAVDLFVKDTLHLFISILLFFI